MNPIFLVLLFVIPLSSAGKPEKEREKLEKQANIEFYKDHGVNSFLFTS